MEYTHTEKKVSAVYKKYGAFWAFSDEQLKESIAEAVKNGAMVEGEKLTRGFAGIICPKRNYKKMETEVSEIYEQGRQIELKEIGRERVILKHLYNHECFYSGNTEDAENVCLAYGIESKEVKLIYYKHLPFVEM